QGDSAGQAPHMHPHAFMMAADDHIRVAAMHSSNPRIAIIGLGYVGLPLAVEFAKHFEVTGFDISARRIARLREDCDDTCEVSADELRAARRLHFSTDSSDLAACDTFIVTVPTP